VPFIVEKKNEYVPAPEGRFRAVVCDVQDLGEVNGQFGTKHKCRVSFQLDELTPKGQRFIVGRQYTVSLHQSSALRELLTTLLGADFEGERVDLETLIGSPCIVAIQQNQGADGNIYGNVASVVPMPRGAEGITVEGYTRHKDREAKLVSQPRHHQATAKKPKPTAETDADGSTDDDVPF